MGVKTMTLVYAVRRTTISISKDMVKHHIQIQGARHVAQLNTVANKDKGGKMFAPQTFFPGMKNVSTFGRNEYVGKRGVADCAELALHHSPHRRHIGTGLTLRT